MRKETTKPGEGYLPDLIKRWVRENRAQDRAEEKSIFSRWAEIVGEEISAHTRVVEVARGELVVEVDSAPLLNELSTYYSEELLQSLKNETEFRGVHGLRFRSGSL